MLQLNDKLEQKYEFLRGLSGLQAKDLKKLSQQINTKKGTTLSQMLKGS